MKKNRRQRPAIHKRFSPWAWLIFIVLTGILIALNYAGSEGLNPTDDGVVLAQSWRIIQGEIPHIDFISIRPVGSGLLHTIHFLFPTPLEITARYFVLFQFFIIAFSWVQFFRLKSNFKHEIPISYQLSILLIAWMFGTYNFNLFSWTTIDAIFWTSLGLYFSERAFHIRRSWLMLSFGIFAFSMAALSRQTFFLFFIFGIIWIAWRIYHSKKYKTAIIALLIGLIPFLAYAIMIAANDAGKAFITQMSGRTDFYDTAINTFWLRFKSSEIRWVNLSIIAIALFGGIARTLSHKVSAFFATLPAMRMVFILETGLILYFFYRSITYFAGNYSENYLLPFLAFWILLDMLLLHISIQENKLRNCMPAWAALFVAWVTAISYGCNTPVFAFGILTIAIIWLYLKKHQDALLLKQNWLRIALPAISLIITIITIKSQFEVNYRDLGKSQHTHNLSKINPAYGNITTNENTFSYFSEIDSLIQIFQTRNESFVFIPDNAIIYPIYRLTNPLPLDWAQTGEMPLQELAKPLNPNEPFNKSIQWKIDEGVIFAIQKINTKTMHEGFTELKYWKYYYFHYITSECNLLFETEFFKVYKKS
ncbi:MAG: hypothetical protein U9N51_04990 [Bacteroidota bacterium]|nr:hypothetical protein [Bacteroidota bacterium]